jgi:hypothetical protein
VGWGGGARFKGRWQHCGCEGNRGIAAEEVASWWEVGQLALALPSSGHPDIKYITSFQYSESYRYVIFMQLPTPSQNPA